MDGWLTIMLRAHNSYPWRMSIVVYVHPLVDDLTVLEVVLCALNFMMCVCVYVCVYDCVVTCVVIEYI